MLPKLVRDHPVASRQLHPRKQALNCRSLIGKDFGYRVTDMKASISIAEYLSDLCAYAAQKPRALDNPQYRGDLAPPSLLLLSHASFISFFIVDAHRNEILLRYFGTPNDRLTQVNEQIVYARFFYDRTWARRLPFKELFIQVPFAFACKRLRFHNRSDL